MKTKWNNKSFFPVPRRSACGELRLVVDWKESQWPKEEFPRHWKDKNKEKTEKARGELYIRMNFLWLGLVKLGLLQDVENIKEITLEGHFSVSFKALIRNILKIFFVNFKSNINQAVERFYDSKNATKNSYAHANPKTDFVNILQSNLIRMPTLKVFSNFQQSKNVFSSLEEQKYFQQCHRVQEL